MKCSRCQVEAPSGAEFCLECGAKLRVVCSQSSTPNSPDHKFCKKCGQRLVQADIDAPKFGPPDKYTPKHLAEKILTSKSVLEGERKQVTVLFADLKGAKELLADRDAEEARKLLDPVLERMRRPCTATRKPSTRSWGTSSASSRRGSWISNSTFYPCLSPPEHLAEMVRMIDQGKISGKIAKALFEELLDSGESPEKIVREKGLEQVSDLSSIETAIDQDLAAHSQQVSEYRSGNEKVLGFLVGQIMKATHGKANPQMVNEILNRKLQP